MDQEAELTDLLDRSILFPHLFEEAERVRWTISGIEWDAIDKAAVGPGWLALARETTFAEMTTYNATERFLTEFSEDVDFTQWLSVWLYEETKHPFVLMRWLHAFGETFNKGDMLKGRQTYPFMNSRMGTLATNIFSEVTASSLYLTLMTHCPEPVLKKILKHLAGDEARHASHFYAFAKKRIDSLEGEEKQQAIGDAIKVLYFWLETNNRVTHPVNLVVQRFTTGKANVLPSSVWDETIKRAQARMLRISGNLVGRTFKTVADVVESL